MIPDEISKILLWIILGFFCFLALFVFSPFISYIIIGVGIIIPAYLLYKRKKEEDD